MFKRASSTPTAPTPSEPVTSAAPGKGKATPKRRQAEAARRTSFIDRATAGGRGRGGRMSREELATRREAMRRGDENALPARDRGPVRRFVRDYVDARRNVGGLFIPVGLPVIVLAYTRVPILVVLGFVGLWGFVLGVVIDSFLLVRGVRKQVATRFPGEPTQGLAMYAITRAMQMRRLRMPAPRVARGAKV